MKYTSPSTGEEITEANYIAELISQNKAIFDNNGSLPYKYWNIPKYKKFYTVQLIHISRLLKKFDAIAIINTVKNNKRIWSLAPKWVVEKIQVEQKKYDVEKEKTKETTQKEIKTFSKRRSEQSGKKKNMFGEL